MKHGIQVNIIKTAFKSWSLSFYIQSSMDDHFESQQTNERRLEIVQKIELSFINNLFVYLSL